MKTRSVYRESGKDSAAAPAEETSLLERVKRAAAAAVILTALVIVAAILGGDGGKANEHWTFIDAATPEELGLVAHGAGGAWGLEDHEPATGGRALANHEGVPGAAPALLVATQPRSRDVRTRTRCKVAGIRPSGAASAPSRAACGVLFRFVDAENHWVVRVDAGTAGVEAALVARGVERVLGRASLPEAMTMGDWAELDVEARGDVVRVAFGGRPLFVAEAPSVPAAVGFAGLWAPSEATVFFDHFTIETLSPAPQALEILPLLGRRQG